MGQKLFDDIGAFIFKYLLLISVILGGALTQVFMLNKKGKLSFSENCAVILSGCIVGGTYAVVAQDWQNKMYLALSGLVSMAGYNICNFIIVTSKDPIKMKDMIVGVLKKFVDSLQ